MREEWHELSSEIQNLGSISQFKKALLNFIRPNLNPVYYILDPIGLKFLTRLRLEFSHLREHKYRHNFCDTNVPFCSCGMLEAETTEHFLQRCPTYSNERAVLLDRLNQILPANNLSKGELVHLLLYGNSDLSDNENMHIIQATIKFLKNTGRFDTLLS